MSKETAAGYSGRGRSCGLTVEKSVRGGTAAVCRGQIDQTEKSVPMMMCRGELIEPPKGGEGHAEELYRRHREMAASM